MPECCLVASPNVRARGDFSNPDEIMPTVSDDPSLAFYLQGFDDSLASKVHVSDRMIDRTRVW